MKKINWLQFDTDNYKAYANEELFLSKKDAIRAQKNKKTAIQSGCIQLSTSDMKEVNQLVYILGKEGYELTFSSKIGVDFIVECKKIQNVFFLDTETTGVGPDAEMLSIAVIDQDGNVLLDTYVTPVTTKEWPNAMAVNGITPEFIFEGNFPTADELTYQIASIIENSTIVMYGADFDSRFIKTPLYITGAKTACCMARFSDYMGEWDPKRNAPKRHKLIKAAELVGHTWTNTPHGALADALATKDVWAFLDREGHTQADFYL